MSPRGEDGYVILWGDAVVRLRDALRNGDATAAAPPLHLIIPNQPASCEGLVTGAAADVRAADAAPAGSSPNPDLFDQLRQWAYRTPRGADRLDWDRTVLDKARRLNKAIVPPLPAKRVASVATSVATWVWSHLRLEYTGKPPSNKIARARQDGIASGAARRRGTRREFDRNDPMGKGGHTTVHPVSQITADGSYPAKTVDRTGHHSRTFPAKATTGPRRDLSRRQERRLTVGIPRNHGGAVVHPLCAGTSDGNV